MSCPLPKLQLQACYKYIYRVQPVPCKPLLWVWLLKHCQHIMSSRYSDLHFSMHDTTHSTHHITGNHHISVPYTQAASTQPLTKRCGRLCSPCLFPVNAVQSVRDKVRHSTKEPHPARDGWPHHTYCVVGREVVGVVVAEQGKVEHYHQPPCEGQEVGSHPLGDILGVGGGRDGRRGREEMEKEAQKNERVEGEAGKK